ncbi:MAG TPA: hypothetical protein VH114_11675, partial [Candidatus Acidoferrum sp.]|nr:hypothetical protein [Candidatus Acidoferrum sp.]
MFRKLFVLALFIIALHIAAVSTLGTSPAGSFVGNLLQIVSCGLAVAACFAASRRAFGLSRPFWLFVGCGLAIWGVANLGWTYYETVLRMEPPPGSVVRFLFGTQSIFFALAVFLNPDKDSSNLDPESVLDFMQIGIVFFFIYVGFYYLPAHHLEARSAFAREIWVETGENAALVALALVQVARARVENVRKLYRGFAVYLLIFTIFACGASYVQLMWDLPTGTWFDLAWTVPLLGAALWAARWQPTTAPRTLLSLRPKGFGDLVLTNATLALAPLIVLLQVAQLGTEWRALRFTLLGVSIVCYAARLGVTQYRQ